MTMIRICPAVPLGYRATGRFEEKQRADGSTYEEEVIEPIPLAGALAAQVEAVKVDAGRRILEIAPDWKQRNLTARAAELALLYPGLKGVDLPEPERTEYMAGQAVWDAIKAVRTASNGIEAALIAAAAVDGATAADVLAVDVLSGWPS